MSSSNCKKLKSFVSCESNSCAESFGSLITTNNNTTNSGSREKRSLQSETLALATAITNKKIESGIIRVTSSDSRVYQINLRVSKQVYEKWHSLNRDSKRVTRAVFEKLVESIAEKGFPEVTVASLSIAISSPIQIVQQIVEKAGTRELREKLKKAEEAILCTAKTLQTYRENCRETCIENIKRCIKRYWG